MNHLANLRASTEAILERNRAVPLSADQLAHIKEALLTAELLLRVGSEFTPSEPEGKKVVEFLKSGGLPLLMRQHAAEIVALLAKVPL